MSDHDFCGWYEGSLPRVSVPLFGEHSVTSESAGQIPQEREVDL